MAANQTLKLPNNRILGYATYGSSPLPTTPTILYFHGFPTSRLEAAFLASTKIPIHIVAIDRPGMGLSTFQPSRRILDWPSDVLAIVNHLDIKQFHVVADSGGAPYALVCAKDVPRTRLLSTTVVSGIYPLSLGTQGMMFGNKVLLFAAAWLPQVLLTKFLDWEFGNLARSEDKKEFEQFFMKEMDGRKEKDRRCLDDLNFREIVVESMREAFRQGSEGAAWDCKLFGQWEFGLEEVSGENVTLWHGKEDVNAPFAMAEKAARLMKGCELRAFEEETHLSLPFNHMEEIVRGLLKL